MRVFHLASLALLAIASPLVFGAPVTVTPSEDAEGTVAAGSGTGDARAAGDCSYLPVAAPLPGCLAGAAASGSGDADACGASYGGLVPCAAAAATAAGDARACDADAGATRGCAGVAASLLGGSEGSVAAASATGPAEGPVAGSLAGPAFACRETPYASTASCVGVAASGAGPATSCDTVAPAYRPTAPPCIGVATSGAGDASACRDTTASQGYGFPTSYVPTCVGVAGTLAGDARACDEGSPPPGYYSRSSLAACVGLAVSPFGDATTCRTGFGYANPCLGVALSGCRAHPEVCAAESAIPFVSGLRLGPDADGDGIPADAVVETSAFVVDRATGASRIERTAGSDVPVRLDPDDEDPRNPLVEEVSVSFFSAARAGPDSDRDGVPATVVLEGSRLVVNRTDPPPRAVRDPAGDRTVVLDSADHDPERPVASTVVAVVPTAVDTGPDADGDGFPAYVVVESTRVRLDRREGSVTLHPAPESRRVVGVDAADTDPERPVRSVFSVAVVHDAEVGPDSDGDGVPRWADLAFARVVVDRRTASVDVVPSPDRVRVPLDGADDDPNRPAPSVLVATAFTNGAVGPDADGDGLPRDVRAEATRLTFDRRDGSLVATRDPASDRSVPLDRDDADPRLSPLADARVAGDAEADVLAASLDGDARATCAAGACVAFAPQGEAFACTSFLACVAAAGTGDASGYVAVSAFGDAESCDLRFLCTAASGVGDARASDVAVAGGSASSGYVALAGTEDADAPVGWSLLGTCSAEACADARADGDASARWLAATARGASAALVAASVEGDADGALAAGSGTGAARGGLVGASATGDSEGGLVAASVTGEATAPVAVDGTGP